MSKVKNPLFSSEARGSLGKTLTYGKWHNVDIVKMHSSPANPKTAAQQSQRTLYGQAVGFFRSGDLNQADLNAWRLWARILGGKMSYYNLFIRECIRSLKEFDYFNLHNFHLKEPIGSDSISLEIDKDCYGVGAKLKYGSRPRSLINTANLNETIGTLWCEIEDWPDKTNIYFQFMMDDETNKTGIYRYYVEYS